MSENEPPQLQIETFGCRLNAYESEAMKTLIEKTGRDDLIVINTCAVTQEAVRQAKQKIRSLKRQNPAREIVVTGCAAQTGAAIFAAMPEVAHVFGNDEKLQMSSWQKLGHGTNDKVDVGDIMESRKPLSPMIDGLGTRARAYVQVQNGCDHRCTFCIIPYGRGNSRSVPAKTVIEQVKRLVARGFQEVVLTGVDMTSWGADLEGAPKLGGLVEAIITNVPDLPRLRVSSIDSIEVDEALFEIAASEPRFMPHLHLSLQAGDNLTLKRMKRRHLRDDAIAFCSRLRTARPDIVYGADFIAGFPTETDEMFENTMKLVEECGLTWLHVFPYSKREGTPAAKMPQVHGAAIKERAARLRALGDAQVESYLRTRDGKIENILMENPNMGRNEGFAEVRFDTRQRVGQIVRVKVNYVEGAGLRATS